MRLWSIFRKSLCEQMRELWLVALVVAMAPFFVILMSLVYRSGTFNTKVVIVSHDEPVQQADGVVYRGGEEVIEAIRTAKTVSGSPAVTVLRESDHGVAEKMLTAGKAHALIEIPAGFSRAISAARETAPSQPAELVYMGDMASTTYMVAAVLAVSAVSGYLDTATGHKSPVTLVERALGGSGARSELDVALPGIFVLAIIMLLFPVAMSLARESETGCLRRLQLTRMSAFDLLGGISLVQILVGISSLFLAFVAARILGFKSQGPFWAAVLISIVASFATIGVGLLVACFSRSVTEAFLIGNFPMILLMFFSGSMIPIPKVPIFTVGHVVVGLWDWLPTTHAVSAMNKIVGIGMGLGDVMYELCALVVLSAAYFFGGVWLFKCRRMVAG